MKFKFELVPLQHWTSAGGYVTRYWVLKALKMCRESRYLHFVKKSYTTLEIELSRDKKCIQMFSETTLDILLRRIRLPHKYIFIYPFARALL